MPTVDATPTALSTTATAGRTATGGVAATAATGLDGLFAEMMAAFTKTIGLPTDPTTTATSPRTGTAAVTGTAPALADAGTDDPTTDDTVARKAAETAAADLAGVMALVAQGQTIRLADGGGLASPASLGARTATGSATSAVTAGLDPTHAPADRSVAASATAAGTATASSDAGATSALVDAAVAAAKTAATGSTAPVRSTAAATPATSDTPATPAVDPTGGLAAATATLAAATEARLDAAATAQAAAIARSAAPATAAATGETTNTTTTAAAADDGLGLKSFVARRIAPERSGGDAPRSHFTAAATTDTAAAPAAPAALRTDRLTALAERPVETTAPTTAKTDPTDGTAGDVASRPLASTTDDLATALHARRGGDTATPIATADAGKPADDEPEPPRTDDTTTAVSPAAARIATPAETVAHRPTTTATADVAAVPLAAVAEHVAARAASGTSRFTVKLDPAELGSIDVRVEVRPSGEVRAHLVVERADTLDMMLRDQKNLERSLGAAGLDVSSSGLQFSLRDQNRRDGGGDDRTPTRSTESDEIDEIAPRITQEAAIAAYRPLRAGGLDLRI